MRENPYLHNNEIPFRLLTLLILFLIIISTLLLINHAYSQVENPSVIPTQPAPGEPLPGLTPEQLIRFQKGSQVFRKVFKPEEGLGPIFNQNACFICHGSPTAGGSQIGFTQNVTRFGKGVKGETFDPLEHLGGSLRQAQGTKCAEQVPAEANITTIRTSPILFGSGLIESIPDSVLKANENNPATGGKAHMVKLLEDLNGPDHVGRFGWKAQLATTLSFAADASNNEIGLSNELLPAEQRPNALPSVSLGDLPCDDGVPDPDDRPNAEGVRLIDELRDFVRYLAPPPQTPKSGMTGETIFTQIGCNKCHIPSFTTPQNDSEPALSEKTIKVYSDFLLHNMGELADGIQQGNAGPKQMKTPPLWGQRFRFAGLLHDQRSRDYDTVIKAHNLNMSGSEAKEIVDRYLQLSPQDKQYLYAFLDSLGRREFDQNGAAGFFDAGISDADFISSDPTKYSFSRCYREHGSPDKSFTPDHPCAISDIDQNGIVNQVDFNSLLTVYSGPSEDCQCNGQNDLWEILNGSSIDANADVIPDECRPFQLDGFFGPLGNILEVKDGKISVSLSARQNFYGDSSLLEGEEVEFFFSFQEQGSGIPFGDVFCLNIINQQSLGTALVIKPDRFSSLRTNPINVSISVPQGTRLVSFQAGVLNGGKNSRKSQVLTFQLQFPPLPINGQWCAPVDTACSVSCGGGTFTRTRTCACPAPQNGGANCDPSIPASEVIACNTQACPINGQWCAPVDTPCSVSCGGGTLTRTRTCACPTPQNGGANCDPSIPASEVIACNTQACPIGPINGQWCAPVDTPCSVSCGGGTLTRTRTCACPAPQNGGANCDPSLPASEVIACNTQACPVFIRGNANNDGRVDISDAIFIFRYLFDKGIAPLCFDAADANDDGIVDISDAIRILNFLFVDNKITVPPPYPAAGIDPTFDDLGCGL